MRCAGRAESVYAIHPAVQALSQLLGAANVLSDPNELSVYECDGLPIAKGRPLAVAFPKDTPQVKACVELARRHGVPLIPRGSGTGLAGGAVAFEPGILICTSRMNRIESIDLANRIAIVQAGVLNLALSQAVEKACIQAGFPTPLHFSPDPSSQRAATIAGNAATNAGGINTLKHGVTSNHILGLEMVLPDGQILQTRTAGLYDGYGPDLPGLLCGSEGTLGIITRLWCRLTPRPENYRTVYAVFADTADACNSVSDVIAAGLLPASMEMMDGQMIRVVEDAFHYGFPTDAQALLLIEIDGIPQVLDEQLELVVQICRQNSARDVKQCSDPKKRAELWSARKSAFGAIGRLSHSYCTQDACVPRSQLAGVMARVVEIGKQYGLTITSVFHAGDGNIHPILIFDDRDPKAVRQAMLCSRDILEHCLSVGGTITGEHGVGIEKLSLMSRQFTLATLDVFKKIKTFFDPEHRCNEGKLIPSDRLNITFLPPSPPPKPDPLLHPNANTIAPETNPLSRPNANTSPQQKPSQNSSNQPLIEPLEHHRRDFTLTTSTGTTLGEIHRYLKSSGQFLAIDGDDDLTLRQAIDENRYGPLRLGYGTLRDQLLGLVYRNAQGQEIRVGGRTVKNVAGYDVTKLLVGSMGRLGQITQATLRTYAIPDQTLRVDLQVDQPERIDQYNTHWMLSDALSSWASLGWRQGQWTMSLGYYGTLAGGGDCTARLTALETLLGEKKQARITNVEGGEFERDRLTRQELAAWRAQATTLLKIVVPPARAVQTAMQSIKAFDRSWPCVIDVLPSFGVIWLGGTFNSLQAGQLIRSLLPIAASHGGFLVTQAMPESAGLSVQPLPSDQPLLDRLIAAMNAPSSLSEGQR